MSSKGSKKVVYIKSELDILVDEEMLQLFAKVTAPDNILPQGMKLSTSFEDNTWKLTISGTFSLGRLKYTWNEIIQHLILISQCNSISKNEAPYNEIVINKEISTDN
jgi:hypothetical protein